MRIKNRLKFDKSQYIKFFLIFLNLICGALIFLFPIVIYGAPLANGAIKPFIFQKSVPYSRVSSVNKNEIVFIAEKFSRVKIGDIFYVLNVKQDGVLAKIKCQSISVEGEVFADLVELGQGATAAALLQAVVLQDKDILDVADKFSLGPLSLDALVAEGEANKLKNRSLNPSALFFGGFLAKNSAEGEFLLQNAAPEALSGGIYSLELFLPRARFAYWLKGLGLQFDWERLTSGVVKLKGATSGVNQSLSLTHSSQALSVLWRWTFDVWWISRFGIIFSPWRKEVITSTIDTLNSFESGSSKTTMLKQGYQLGISLESQPLINAISGMRILFPYSQKMNIENNAQGTIVAETGTWSKLELDLWLGMRYLFKSLPHRFQCEANVGFIFNQNSISSPSYQDGAAQNFSGVSKYVKVGIGYVK